MPSIIDITRNARLSYFTRNKSKFINIDKLIQCCVASKERDFETYKNRIETYRDWETDAQTIQLL